MELRVVLCIADFALRNGLDSRRLLDLNGVLLYREIVKKQLVSVHHFSIFRPLKIEILDVFLKFLKSFKILKILNFHKLIYKF